MRSFTVHDDELEGKSRRSPYFTLLFFMAKQRKVKDWNTGIPIHEKLTGKSHALQYHHIFPKATLNNRGVPRKSINDIANLAFISGKTNRNISDKDPAKYLASIEPKNLRSQYITTNPTLWKLENFEDFLQHRRKSLVKEINSFIEGL